MRFASRVDAGRQLGQHLLKQGVEADIVLGLPRGGVVVAAEVARALQCPLDVLIVRKIGHPWQREFAVGALAEPDVVIFDKSFKWKNPLARAELDGVIAEETARLREYRLRFLPRRRAVAERQNGFAGGRRAGDGATAEAAVLSARKQKCANCHRCRAGRLDECLSKNCSAWRMKLWCWWWILILERWANTMKFRPDHR